jgi:hypothetical protein
MDLLEATALTASTGSGALCGVLGYRAAKRRARRHIAWMISCAALLLPLIVLVQLPPADRVVVWKPSALRIVAAVSLWVLAFCIGELHLHLAGAALLEAKLLSVWFGGAVIEAPIPGVRGFQGLLGLDGNVGGLLSMTIIGAAFAALLRRPSGWDVAVLCSLSLLFGILARATQLVVSVGSWLSNRYAVPHLPSEPVSLAFVALFWATVWFASHRVRARGGAPAARNDLSAGGTPRHRRV